MREIKYHIPSGDNELAPVRATPQSAGLDMKAAEEVTIAPFSTAIVKTGVIFEIPDNHVGLLALRSSMAAKKHFMMANGVGIIDADFRGEVGVILYNAAAHPQTIEKHQRIAQLTVVPFYHAAPVAAADVSQTERGTGGYGSTGK